nr:hypothetical protein [Tanacetum cinerariifolium]
MSRDVLTVGSTMRIPLLYRGEYSQWVERFMNYLEEQTDEEAMINSIKNDKYMWSDQEKRVQKIDRLARSLLIQRLPNDIYSLIDSNKTAKDLWDALARHMLGFEYDEQDRKAAYATMMRQNKNLIDINIDALYNILKQNQGDVNDAMGSKKKTVVVTFDPLALIAEKTKSFSRLITRELKRKMMTKRDTSKVKCYNCKKEGHFAKDCKKAKVKDYEYYKTKMLLAKKDKDEQVLWLKTKLGWSPVVEDREDREDREVADAAKDVEEAKIDESAQDQGRQVESQAKIYKIDMDHANKVLSIRRKGVVIKDPKEESTTSTIILGETKSKDKGKGILDEAIDHVKKKANEDPAVKRYQVLKRNPQTKAQARKNMVMYLKKVAGFKMNYFKGMSYDDIPKRRKLDDEVEELKSHLQIVPNEEDDVYTEATRLARKVPVVDYQIIEMNNKPYYKIIRADDTHQLYISFLTLLRNFDREDLEALWSLVKERFSITKPKNFYDDFLLVTLGAMFEKPDIHAQIWKNQRTVHGPAKVIGWKLLESCGVQIITFTSTQLILLVERKYPLTRFTLDQMLNAIRLEVK